MSHQRSLIFVLRLVLLLLVLSGATRCTLSRDETPFLEASAEVQIPCTDPLIIPTQAAMANGQPHLVASPPCGELSDGYEHRGSSLVLVGSGFNPNTPTRILWEDHFGNEFQQHQEGKYLEIVTDQSGGFEVEVVMPYRIYPPESYGEVVVWTVKAQQGEIEEPSEPVHVSLIVEHGLVSIAGWLLGLTVGSSLGYGIAVFIRRLYTRKPTLRRSFQLIPWRTALMILLLLLMFPLFIVMQVGLGARTGIISVGLTALLLTLTFTTTTLLNHWDDTPVYVRFISWARTLATAAVVLEFLVGPYGGGGVGFAVIQYIRLLDRQTPLRYAGPLVAIMLLLDLMIGGIQYCVVARTTKNSMEAASDGEAA